MMCGEALEPDVFHSWFGSSEGDTLDTTQDELGGWAVDRKKTSFSSSLTGSSIEVYELVDTDQAGFGQASSSKGYGY